jgi:hypothetical protein
MDQESVTLIEKTNLTLKTAGLNASIISVDQLRFAAPVIFVKVFEIFFGRQLDKINYSPTNRFEHAMNIDIVLHALQSRYDSPLLHQTTGNLVVSGDLRSIEIIMSIFYGVAQRIVNEREDSLKKSSALIESEPKQPKTRSFYRSNTTQETISGELKVIMARVNNLEGKVHLSIFNEPETRKKDRPGDDENKSESGHRRVTKEKKTRPTSAPPGGRKKKMEKKESETHLVLLGEPEENNWEASFEAKPKKQKKKSKKKMPIEREESPPRPSEPARHSVDNLYAKSHSLPIPRPASAGHRRPKAPTEVPEPTRPDFSKRSSSHLSQPAGLGGLYTYDLRTGRQISKRDAEELLEQKKQRLLAMGAIVTDDGELRALNSNAPITLHDLLAARDKQKQNEEKHQGGIQEQFEPTLGEYPGRRTEQSVENYQKKMATLREPVEIISLPSQKIFFPSYKHLDPLDMVISIEHCHECESHTSVRHLPLEYIQHADDILRSSAQLIHSLHPCLRLGVIRFPAKINGDNKLKKTSGVDLPCRIGALEVQVGYKNHRGEVIYELIYSKLNTKRWPSKSVIEKRLMSVVSQFGLQSYSDSGEATYESRRKDTHFPYPVGIGPWSEVPLADPLWKFSFPPLLTQPLAPSLFLTPDTLPTAAASPSEPQQPKRKQNKNRNQARVKKGPQIPNANVQWCFDSKGYAFFPKFKVGVAVRILNCPNSYGGVESYSCGGTIRHIFKDFTSLENMVTVFLNESQVEISVNEDLCIAIKDQQRREIQADQWIPFTDKDPNPPPQEFDRESNNIPHILASIIRYGVVNDLLYWRIQCEDDSEYHSSSAPNTTFLRLCRASFHQQVQELVWQGIAASPGVKTGMMILPDEGEVDVQVAYCPAVIETIFDRYDGKSVDITTLMKAIQPSLTDQQIQTFNRRKPLAPPQGESEAQITTSSNEVQKELSPSLVPSAVPVPVTDIDEKPIPQEGQLLLSPVPVVDNQITTTLPQETLPTVAPAPIVEPISTPTAPYQQLPVVANQLTTPPVQGVRNSPRPTLVPSLTALPQPIIEKQIIAPPPQRVPEPIVERDIPQSDLKELQPAHAPTHVPVADEGDYADDFETLPQDSSPTHFSLYFVFVEIVFKNRPEDKLNSLSLEFEYQDQSIIQSCPISQLEGQSGKRIIGDMDWNPIQFDKSDFLRSGGPVLVKLKNRNTLIGRQQLTLKDCVSLTK